MRLQTTVNGYKARFPLCRPGEYTQDQEFCDVENEDNAERIRFHDYYRLYSKPGLYEYIFYEKLKCNSPEKVFSLLEEQVERTDLELSDLVVLDLGAGNGMVGEELVRKGVKSVVGVDIIEEADENLMDI